MGELVTFEPLNELEVALLAARKGQLPVLGFMDKLLRSQVAVLVDKDPGSGGQWDNSVAPMVLTNQTGDPVLAVFTAMKRSAQWPDKDPRFRHALLTDFAWLLRGMAPDLGLVINPGLETGLEMPASGVAQLKSRGQRQ